MWFAGFNGFGQFGNSDGDDEEGFTRSWKGM